MRETTVCLPDDLLAAVEQKAAREGIPEAEVIRRSVRDAIGAELDYLVATRHGVAAELAVLCELAAGAWDPAAIDAAGLAEIRSLVERFADHAIGVTDASCVFLAEQFHTRSVCTLDHRHFTVVRTTSGAALDIVP